MAAAGAPHAARPTPHEVPAPPAAPEAKRAQRHTTAALRSLRRLLSLSEFGALSALVDAGLSYETGRGAVSYAAWAQAAGISTRQAMRYRVRFAEAGVLEREIRWHANARERHDKNRVNRWGLPVFRPGAPGMLDGPLEEFLAATDDGAEGAAEIYDAAAARVAGAAIAPTSNVEAVPEGAAKFAAPSSFCAKSSASPAETGSTSLLGPDVACVLAELRRLPELASIAETDVAGRLWGTARRHQKTLATTLQALSDLAEKAAGRTGPTLESAAVSFIRIARPVVPAPAPKTPEDDRRARERAAEVERTLEEKAQKQRDNRARAAAALAEPRGPPPDAST